MFFFSQISQMSIVVTSRTIHELGSLIRRLFGKAMDDWIASMSHSGAACYGSRKTKQ